MPGRIATEQRKFVSERCVISTPFGSPVDPEVKIT
jgi:hypothetical protein